MDITTIAWGTGTSILATVIVLVVQGYLRARHLRLTFGRMEGAYEVFHNGQRTGETLAITWVGGRVLRVRCETSDSGPWSSDVVMGDAIPEFGRGAYRYDNMPESFGEHTALFNPATGEFTVRVENVTHPELYTPTRTTWRPVGAPSGGPPRVGADRAVLSQSAQN